MKIQYKAASVIIFVGIIIVLLLSLGYEILNQNVVIKEEIKNIQNLSQEVAMHVNSHLEEKASIAITLSSTPLIKNALLTSNHKFSSLLDKERKQAIDFSNQRWMKTTDSNTPFILEHTTNPVAEHLKYQQKLLPGEYGEIFLTNRYGVMIATTGKLTTLAHANKYWWMTAYNDGRGKIFLDDRGFDTSVGGYVLGIVIPIKDNGEIIGILKCNVNIEGKLNDIVKEFDQRNYGNLKMVRSGGLVIAELGITPLSTQIDKSLVESLRQKISGATAISSNSEDKLVAFSPVPITLGSEQYGFGGSKDSIDHIKGNEGEGWHVVIFLDTKDALESNHQTTQVIVVFGILLTILISVIALFLSRWATKPIVELATTAQSFGEGCLDTRTGIVSNDEIGLLAKSLNKMANNIQETITLRDDLLAEFKNEIKQRTEAETEIKILRGIIPICSYCHSIRDEEGAWDRLEAYLSKHSDAAFSHGICPKCITKARADAGLDKST